MPTPSQRLFRSRPSRSKRHCRILCRASVSSEVLPLHSRLLEHPDFLPRQPAVGDQADGAVVSSYSPMVQLGKRKGGDVAAIFVHAGAGYHSLHNEKNHLKACEE